MFVFVLGSVVFRLRGFRIVLIRFRYWFLGCVMKVSWVGVVGIRGFGLFWFIEFYRIFFRFYSGVYRGFGRGEE